MPMSLQNEFYNIISDDAHMCKGLCHCAVPKLKSTSSHHVVRTIASASFWDSLFPISPLPSHSDRNGLFKLRSNCVPHLLRSSPWLHCIPIPQGTQSQMTHATRPSSRCLRCGAFPSQSLLWRS